ncbi:hypothetical protein EDC45_0959 [Mesocricetibacter intestinalis]|uniref:Uncharacterized protein n=1 Tax=Mesocricetibacter intestinalis TaxID=1521930 RepID=A0A4R6VCA0_9PAST|nr:hypothetical protein [Mesocricetibacter intestinalis]TDQ57893.1 hypothetical protein EDC45_0959 [Mesocricetibacter intestinalis]
MRRAIITPTFQPHFKFVKKFLDSAIEYLVDPENVTFFFTVSESDFDKISVILEQYKSKLKIEVIVFERLLERFNLKYSDKKLLFKYGKFSYQTLKKFYTMLYIEYDQMLVLDSESMFIRKVRISNLFDLFFNNPFITICELDYLPKTGWFKQKVMENISLVLSKEAFDNKLEKTEMVKKYDNIWPLENFVWFYDKNILNDMFNDLGDPLSVVDYIYQNAPSENREQGCFEICLYQTYIYKNNKKYNYSIFKTGEILNSSFGNNPKLYDKYEELYYRLWQGEFGILEMVMCLLTENNTRELAESLKKYNFSIIRCDFTNLSNYKYQKEFLDIVKPSILAASQGHIWGVNNNLRTKIWNLLVFNSAFARYIYRDLKNIFRPFKPFFYWLRSFYYIGKHSCLWAYQLATNLNILKK